MLLKSHNLKLTLYCYMHHSSKEGQIDSKVVVVQISLYCKYPICVHVCGISVAF